MLIGYQAIPQIFVINNIQLIDPQLKKITEKLKIS